MRTAPSRLTAGGVEDFETRRAPAREPLHHPLWAAHRRFKRPRAAHTGAHAWVNADLKRLERDTLPRLAD